MFEIKQRSSTVGREVLGGVTTFMAMSYIIFVQVGLLGAPQRGRCEILVDPRVEPHVVLIEMRRAFEQLLIEGAER